MKQRPWKKRRQSKVLLRMYERLNRRWFSRRLPSGVMVAWMSVKESDKLKSLARTNFIGNNPRRRIEILVSRRVQFSYRLVLGRMLHEMAHVSAGFKANHGPRFQAEMLRLAKAGALKGAW